MPQQIDVPGMGIVEFPDGMDDNAITAAIQNNVPAPEKPFLEKLGTFARKVYENPPPSIAAVRDVIKGAPAAATELTWGADPQVAERAAGTIAQGAQLGLGFRGLGGEGVFGRRISTGGGGAPVPTPVPPAGTASQQAVEAASRLPGGGVTLPGYLATEGTVMPQMAAGLKNVPWAGQPIVRTAEDLTTNLGGAAREIAPGAGSMETAGQAAKSGITDYIKAGSKGEVGDAYRAVDALINPNVRMPLTHTGDMVATIQTGRAQARIPGTSKAVDRVMPAVMDPSGMDYQGAKMLRTWLGETTPQQLVAEGINPVEAKRLYGALTKDLGRVITEAGGPEAYSAWRRANTLASVAKGEQKKLSKIVGLTGDAGPEAVFNRLITYANSKAGADMGRLRLAKRAMGQEAWSEIAPVIIDRLGKAAPDTPFSPDRFVTAWGRMSSAAKNELFTGQQYAALSDLFVVSNHVKERITKFGNPSGTARGMYGGLGVSTMFVEPVSTIASTVGIRLAAEAMSRPAIVRAATAVSRASLADNPVRTRRALEVLRAAVQAEGLLPEQPQQEQQGRRL